MRTFQVNAPLPPAKPLTSERGSSVGHRGPDDAAALPSYRNCRTDVGGGGGGHAAFRQNHLMRMKLPMINPLSKQGDWRDLVSGIIAGGSPNSAKDDHMESEPPELDKDICGRHFLFDDNCAQLERTRTVIPPLPRDYRVHRPGNLHPFSLSKELSHSHAGQTLTLGCPERLDLSTSPGLLLPSTLVLSGRNTFSVENCKPSRPKVNYPTYSLLTVKDNQKTQCYPDPVVGAPRSFVHRISELSSLEGETVRQERLKKARKARKPPS